MCCCVAEMIQALRKKGNVLVAVDTAGRTLELIQLLVSLSKIRFTRSRTIERHLLSLNDTIFSVHDKLRFIYCICNYFSSMYYVDLVRRGSRNAYAMSELLPCTSQNDIIVKLWGLFLQFGRNSFWKCNLLDSFKILMLLIKINHHSVWLLILKVHVCNLLLYELVFG